MEVDAAAAASGVAPEGFALPFHFIFIALDAFLVPNFMALTNASAGCSEEFRVELAGMDSPSVGVRAHINFAACRCRLSWSVTTAALSHVQRSGGSIARICQ